MEINLENRLRRTEQLIRPDGTKRDAAVEEKVSSAALPQADSLSPLSQVQKTIDALKEQSQRLKDLLVWQEEQPKKSAPWDMEEAESGDSELDALGEKMKAMMRCQKIAARIMRGDKVPPEDERYLMENDPNGYKLALAMRQPKKDPKEWKSVLDDEEKKSSESSGSAEASSCEESGEPSDAGAAGSGGDTASDSE